LKVVPYDFINCIDYDFIFSDSLFSACVVNEPIDVCGIPQAFDAHIADYKTLVFVVYNDVDVVYFFFSAYLAGEKGI
jgi:hypothetical protein